MATLDTRIPLSFQSPQINTPNQNRLQALAIQGRQLENDTTQRRLEGENALMGMLREGNAFMPDGSLNPSMVPRIAAVNPTMGLKLSGDMQSQKLSRAEAERKGIDWAMKGIEFADTPDKARQYLMDSVSRGLIPQASAEQILTQIPDDPTSFAAWRDRSRRSLVSYSAPNQSTAGYFRVGPGGVEMLSNPNTGQPLMPVTADPGTAGAVAEARASGTETGKATAKAEFSAPQEIATADQMLDTIDAVLNHPGLDSAVGMIQGRLPPLTQGATDFVTKLDQLKGQTFLQAYQTLKGGGQITEIEGTKAENAIANLQRPQSEPQFRQALKDLRDVVVAARKRMVDRISGSTEQQQPPSSTEAPRVASEADFNALPSGSLFIDPTGATRRKP